MEHSVGDLVWIELRDGRDVGYIINKHEDDEAETIDGEQYRGTTYDVVHSNKPRCCPACGKPLLEGREAEKRNAESWMYEHVPERELTTIVTWDDRKRGW